MRELIIEKLYEWSKKPYQRFFKKNEPWNVSLQELLRFPKDSLGFHIGCFLLQHNFEIQPKLEDHDVIHVLTKTGITVVEEIGMQYYLWGNGKRSAYLYMVIFIGTLCYPNRLGLFRNYYHRGRNAHRFYGLDFKKMLPLPIADIQSTFNIK